MANIISRLITVAAVLFALYTGYGYLTSDSKHAKTIKSITYSKDSMILTFNDNQRYVADVINPDYNGRNMLLLYEGKKIWINKDKDKYWYITPVK